MLEMLSVHRPLIMELMLWLMTRSPVMLSRCSGDFEWFLLNDVVVVVIFGFALLQLPLLVEHFEEIQG